MLKFAGSPNYIHRYILTAGILILLILMIIHPAVVYNGALTGLQTWWTIVFPSLLPFFIISEIMISTGIVHFLGVITEPIMRPVFNIPGSGSFAVAVGYASGFPVGAMITANLRKEGLCTRIEAERMLCFTNNSSPLFMLVAVAVGMFNHPALGFYIAGTHYLANITIGVALRFYRREDPERIPEQVFKRGLIERAFKEFIYIMTKETRPIGRILGDAVKSSVNNLLTVGGFIIFFAVLILLLTECQAIEGISRVLALFLTPFGFEPTVYPALASGIFEMTIGAKLASESTAPLLQQVVIVAMILGWSGLSILAQVASMISETDIRIFPFICTRIAHGLLAALYMFFVFNFYNVTPVLSNGVQDPLASYFFTRANILASLKNFFIMMSGFVIFSAVLQTLYYVADFFKLALIRRR